MTLPEAGSGSRKAIRLPFGDQAGSWPPILIRFERCPVGPDRVDPGAGAGALLRPREDDQLAVRRPVRVERSDAVRVAGDVAKSRPADPDRVQIERAAIRRVRAKHDALAVRGEARLGVDHVPVRERAGAASVGVHHPDRVREPVVGLPHERDSTVVPRPTGTRVAERTARELGRGESDPGDLPDPVEVGRKVSAALVGRAVEPLDVEDRRSRDCTSSSRTGRSGRRHHRKDGGEERAEAEGAFHVFQTSNTPGRSQVAVGVSTQLLPAPHSHSSARCRSHAIDSTSIRCVAVSSL